MKTPHPGQARDPCPTFPFEGREAESISPARRQQPGPRKPGLFSAPAVRTPLGKETRDATNQRRREGPERYALSSCERGRRPGAASRDRRRPGRATRGLRDEPHWLEAGPRDRRGPEPPQVPGVRRGPEPLGVPRARRCHTRGQGPRQRPSGVISGSAEKLRRNNAAGRGGGPLAPPGSGTRPDLIVGTGPVSSRLRRTSGAGEVASAGVGRPSWRRACASTLRTHSGSGPPAHRPHAASGGPPPPGRTAGPPPHARAPRAPPAAASGPDARRRPRAIRPPSRARRRAPRATRPVVPAPDPICRPRARRGPIQDGGSTKIIPHPGHDRVPARRRPAAAAMPLAASPPAVVGEWGQPGQRRQLTTMSSSSGRAASSVGLATGPTPGMLCGSSSRPFQAGLALTTSAIRRATARMASAKWVRTSASMRSILARRPEALTRSRAWRPSRGRGCRRLAGRRQDTRGRNPSRRVGLSGHISSPALRPSSNDCYRVIV